MSNSPNLKVNLTNNNVDVSVPLNGVTAVLARTTKGPQNDPSIIINSISQFNRVYGSEIVPDGTVSNIEKALSLGSTLRICRVLSSSATYGTVGSSLENGLFTLSDEAGKKAGFYLRTKYKGMVIGTGGTGINFQAYLSGSDVMYKVVEGDTTLDSGRVFSYATKPDSNFVDYQAISNFFTSNTYFEPVFLTTAGFTITSLGSLLKWLKELDQNSNGYLTVNYNGKALTTSPANLAVTQGESGTAPTLDDWEQAFVSLLDYNDMYQVIASHVNQHLKTEASKFHAYVKNYAEDLQEWIYYIECPKENDTKDKMIAWVNTTSSTVGKSKFIAYFGGGIKYYDNPGILQDCDVLGSVVGLGDNSAINYGPYRSFAGMNRGTLPDALGPVCPNYGSPSRYDDLNDLAHVNLNMIVVKDTRSSGKVTMLWHNFTSQVKQDSFRFISNVRLVLYMKKQFRPIIESYFEEPNIWGTWKRIYLEVKPIIDELVTDNAITDPEWLGDQDATSWSDLQVNTEADARQGRYHVIFKFKDVATMQEVTLDLVVDKATQTSSVTINND